MWGNSRWRIVATDPALWRDKAREQPVGRSWRLSSWGLILKPMSEMVVSHPWLQLLGDLIWVCSLAALHAYAHWLSVGLL